MPSLCVQYHFKCATPTAIRTPDVTLNVGTDMYAPGTQHGNVGPWTPGRDMLTNHERQTETMCTPFSIDSKKHESWGEHKDVSFI